MIRPRDTVHDVIRKLAGWIFEVEKRESDSTWGGDKDELSFKSCGFSGTWEFDRR